MSRSNFTPMKRFHEIIGRYGLRLMEVGTNHLRVFSEGRKLFDYYPLRMKLFDYRQWKQLTYPSLIDGTDKWETRARRHYQRAYGITAINSRIMNGNNSKTLVWDNIPEWAIFALEYGTREELFLSDEDKKMIPSSSPKTFRTATPCRWIGIIQGI